MTYIAQITVGQFNIGEVVTGLSDERASELLKMGAIKKVSEEPPKDNEPPKEQELTDEQSDQADESASEPTEQAKPKTSKAKSAKSA